MFNIQRYLRYRKLKRLWDRVEPGMTVTQAEQIMGFLFSQDSENTVGRVVYSHHTSDYLPFYIVVERSSGKIIRRHPIRALDETSPDA
jgi:hypothetical protein